MLVPQEIRNRQFNNGFNGYKPEEVEEFLEQLTAEFEELYSGNERLKDRLRRLRTQISVFKQTESKLDLIQKLTEPLAVRVEVEAGEESRQAMEAVHHHAEDILMSHREILHRIKHLTEEARALWLIQPDEPDHHQKQNHVNEVEMAGEMGLLEQRVRELVSELDEYRAEVGSNYPTVSGYLPTIELLMADYWEGMTSEAESSQNKDFVEPEPGRMLEPINETLLGEKTKSEMGAAPDSLAGIVETTLPVEADPDIISESTVQLSPESSREEPALVQDELSSTAELSNLASSVDPDQETVNTWRRELSSAETDEELIARALMILERKKKVEVESPPSTFVINQEVTSDLLTGHLGNTFPIASAREWSRLPQDKSGPNRKNRIAWALIFAGVILLGLIGGYLWNSDLISWKSLPGLASLFSREANNPSNQDPSILPRDNQNENLSPLFKAAIANDLEQVKELLASGESPEVSNKKGETPLIIAAYQGNSDIVTALLKAGANPDVQEKEWGVTPLMYAAFEGHIEVVKILLKNNADLDIKNQEGWTGLMCAAFAGRPMTVRLLLAEGADPYVKNQDGWSAYDLAVLAGRDLTVKNMEDAGVNPTGIKEEAASDFTADEKMLNMFSPVDKE